MVIYVQSDATLKANTVLNIQRTLIMDKIWLTLVQTSA
jgi:hypothetical protein